MSWFCSIEKVENGFLIEYPEEDNEGKELIVRHVIEDDVEGDELDAPEALLWWVLDYFGCYGNKHDPERLRIVREKHD